MGTQGRKISVFVLLGLLCLGRSVAAAEPERRVVLTIDDLPFVGVSDPAEVVRGTDGLLAALERFEAPAVAFVTGKHVLVRGQVDVRLDLLRRWRDAGAELANHSFSHRSFNDLPVASYLEDASRGQLFPELLAEEVEQPVRYYRHPFNHTGASEEAKAAFAEYLEARRMRLAPFTVEHADYVFDRLYRAARQRGDEAAAERIGKAYLEQLDIAFDFAESLALETFGRQVPQIFLFHANSINAVYLESMLERLRQRGYRFVTMEEALRDAAYDSADPYVGRTGISWLHRWRQGMELEDRWRQEPDPPAWVIREYRALSER